MNVALTMILSTILVSISSNFMSFPRGLPALIADRHASNVGQVLFIIAIMISSLLSGYVCLNFIGAGFLVSGLLPCVGVAGSLLLHQLLTGPSAVDDVPKTLKVLCFVLSLFLGMAGAYIRLKLHERRTMPPS
ncbi:hypothetical protein HN018_05825 [Lichenicola cladoniae]|uniref:Uncharacterized protein n=1 Tax=Lichenicola cladoniae TaxID=1484109 RepID=A0A6M8HMU8_9PROT|nr:hypothetical protein [Lichenicola cladoniae]NPD67090.1 hypothetical protein [Acetobacteraceae bacterium]QKE89630.1 hypothetical protein HN018_05825 [Lichenicola cladoniae]